MAFDGVQRALKILGDSPRDASPCGPHIAAVLQQLLISLSAQEDDASAGPQAATDRRRDAQKCQMLVSSAKEAIATYPYSEVPPHWRRLYMDASLLQVAAVLQGSRDDRPDVPEAALLDSVRILDMANTITGYFEDGRREVLDSLMSTLQAYLKVSNEFHTSDDVSNRPAKRLRLAVDPEHIPLATATLPKTPLLPSIREITRYASWDEAPDMFELSDITEPFIVTGGVSHWPALSDANTAWKDARYLLSVAGKGRIVPVEIGSSYVAEGWTQKMMDFETFVHDIQWESGGKASSATDQPVVYLAQHDLFQQFPSLLSDVVPPDYVFSCPSPPEHFVDYTPPDTASGYTLNAWMGPKGTYSPAHTDPYYNCYAQVVGSKHIWVAPPECSEFMKGEARPSSDSDSEDETSSAEGSEGVPANAASEHFMDNTAGVDVFSDASLQHAQYVQGVLPRAQQAILSEGDLLFMPPK